MPEMPHPGGGAVPEYHRHSRRKGKPLSPARCAKLSVAAKEHEARK